MYLAINIPNESIDDASDKKHRRLNQNTQEKEWLLHFTESVVIEYFSGRRTGLRVIANTIFPFVDTLLTSILHCARCVESVVNTASDKSHLFA